MGLNESYSRWNRNKLVNLYGGSVLVQGICEKKPRLVKEALDAGEDPNRRYRYKEDNDSITCPYRTLMMTPIVEAAVMGDLDIVKLLVEHGADVNKAQANGESALADAVNQGNVPLTKYLLEHGANPNIKQAFGTPLALADGIETMRLLLEHGADPNIADSDGDLPIIGSIDQCAIDEIGLLITYGTDLNHKNRVGETPLDRAKKRGIFDAVVALKR